MLKSNTTTVTKTITPVKQKKKKNRRKRSRNVKPSSLTCYANLLNDPFGQPSCRIGAGTMAHTELGSVYFRGNINVLADGSLALIIMPSLAQAAPPYPILFSTVNNTTATYGGNPWMNIGQYAANELTECRIIAGALRVTPLVAQTSAPGVVYAGGVSGYSQNNLTALTPAAISNIASLRSFVSSSEPILTTMRPLDNSAYEFTVNSYSGNSSAVFSNTSMVCVLTGFTAGASVLVETILHFEYLPIYTNSLLRDNVPFENVKDKTVSGDFSSLERMWEYTIERLNPSAIMDTTTSLLNLLTANRVRTMLGGARPQRRIE